MRRDDGVASNGVVDVVATTARRKDGVPQTKEATATELVDLVDRDIMRADPDRRRKSYRGSRFREITDKLLKQENLVGN